MSERPPKFWDRRQPHTSFKWNPFTVHGEAPASVRHDPIVTPLIVGGFAAMGLTVSTGVASVIGGVLISGLMMGAQSLLASAAGQEKTPSSQRRGGIQVNGHAAGDTLRIVYGSARTGGTWGWWKTTSTPGKSLNNLLHIVIGWCEGECALDKDLEQPMFKGHGLNDVISKGPYTGTTYDKYQIEIDHTGATDSFKWRVGTGAYTEDVAITGAWQLLSNNVYIKWKAVTGHTSGDKWEMYGGDGLWIGDRLFYSFQGIVKDGVTYDWAEHHFHSGSFIQGLDVDTNPIDGLQTYVPDYDNPHHGTCYSYIRLKSTPDENLNPWQSIPDFRAKLKKIDIIDTRTGNPGYTNNAALIWYDFLTNQRYGRGLATTKAVTADINAAATWCDSDKATHGGSTYTCKGDHTSGSSTEPGVGADWETFWELTGTGGDPWTMIPPTYYRGGYSFDGVILDRKAGNEHLKEIAMNFLGFSFESDGKTRLKTWDDDAAAATFAQFENEVVIEPEAFRIDQPGMEESPDVVVAHFINPYKNWGWDTVSYPDDNSLATIPPSGNLIQIDIELTGTISRRAAKQIAKSYWLRLNLANRYNILCHPKLFAYEPGDMLTLTHEFPGWSAKKLRIDTYGIQQAGLVSVVFMDTAASLYDLEVKISDDEANTSGVPYEEVSYLPVDYVDVTSPTQPTNVNLELNTVKGDKKKYHFKITFDPGHDFDKVTNEGNTYECILGHTSDADKEPGVGAEWEFYWILSTGLADAWVTTTPYIAGSGIEKTEWQIVDPSITASAITHGGTNYTAIQNHKSRANNEPGIGKKWEKFWEASGAGGSDWVTDTLYGTDVVRNGVVGGDVDEILGHGLPVKNDDNTTDIEYKARVRHIDRYLNASLWSDEITPVDNPPNTTPSKIDLNDITVADRDTDNNLATAEVLITWPDPDPAEQIVDWDVKITPLDDVYEQIPNGVDVGSVGRAAGIVYEEPTTPFSGMIKVIE